MCMAGRCRREALVAKASLSAFDQLIGSVRGGWLGACPGLAMTKAMSVMSCPGSELSRVGALQALADGAPHPVRRPGAGLHPGRWPGESAWAAGGIPARPGYAAVTGGHKAGRYPAAGS